MTMMDKVNSGMNAAYNMVFDREELNYMEAAGLYTLTAAGRQNVAALALLYNHAQDSDLKKLLKQAIDGQTEWLTAHSEKFLKGRHGHLPDIEFPQRNLVDTATIPIEARFTDQEIILALGNMARAAQMAVLAAMHATYQPELAIMYRQLLDSAFDFDYRMMQICLNKGWLPYMHKIEH